VKSHRLVLSALAPAQAQETLSELALACQEAEENRHGNHNVTPITEFVANFWT
jgi:hypothetical protein